ncbi:MAG TPA: EAL domain-containing protein [Paenibacillus sp.]|uniref:EAL domain-containing protein n=1 Tax=Paenibacillus sp. TaxID=58172 RepID=UPI0028D3B719|nr:EAL domain-containing protein [Paenibacillus sp.]HUC92092.1 EAL domain-containing protein [Paenibacillus sp.]
MEKQHRIVVFTPHLDGDYFGKLLAVINKITQVRRSELTIVQTQINHPYDSPIDDPLFVDNMDACIILLDCVGPVTRDRLARCGKPVVAVGFIESAFPCHSVVIDNRTGIRNAVSHLAMHGHTDIAYVGGSVQYDQIERFEAFKAALEENGLALHPELAVRVDDNMERDGIQAAERLLQCGRRFTAVVAASDRNAIGLIHSLEAHGLSVPHDVAVTGFDNMEQAAGEPYSLSTVRQGYEELAQAAMDILYRIPAGKAPAAGVTQVPVRFIRRSSCGCPSVPADPAVETVSSRQTIIGLRNALRLTEQSHSEWIRNIARTASAEKIELADLFWNSSHWGYLALWNAERTELVVDRAFSRKGHPAPAAGKRYRPGAFPDTDLLPPSVKDGGGDIVIVHPVKNDHYDWGFIVLVGPFDELSGLFISHLGHQSYNILAGVLERELLFEKVRTMADRLEIVSRTTNDGIWDYDIVSEKVEWNIRFRTMLGSAGEQLTEDPESLFKLVHPDDELLLRRRIHEHLVERKPFQIEFRIILEADTVMWVYAAGEAVRRPDGRPIRMIGSFTDITMKKADEERIVRLAYHDMLTGLPNRLFFMERLERLMPECRRNGSWLAVLLMDLDRFKIINDTLGHQAGDKLLQHVADKIRLCIRPGDTIARLGGDEFVVLLSKVHGSAEVERIAGAIARQLADPLVEGGREIFTTASIGACLFPMHADSPEILIKHADMAMYKAKENGRDQMVFYTPDLSSLVEKRFLLGNNLRKAIERGELELHYQPQVDMHTGRVIGAEALLRWHSAEHGTVQPSDFIPLAEETGWIIPISVWVIREACDQIVRWREAGLPPLVVSVNISAQHFRLGDFSRWVKSVLDEKGVEPQSLGLEITETTAIQNMEHSAQMLRELAVLGLPIAIDDFGTGHSSLTLLKRLPIRMIKIDKSFTRDMTLDQDDAAIVKAVIAMSHSLGLSVIAEGVEMQSQVRHLRLLGCDYIQGFYIGRPMTADRFTGFLAGHFSDGARGAADPQ